MLLRSLGRLAAHLPVLCLVLASLPPARAHDTWFEVQTGPRAGQLQLALGTGNRFPQQEFSIAPAMLAHHGCRHGRRAAVPLRPLRQTRSALLVTSVATAGAQRDQDAALTCWAQLHPLHITIEPALVAVYLDEIAAPAAVRAAWQAMQLRGVSWSEHYTKHARAEVLDRRLGGGDAPPAQPLSLGLDIVLESGLDRLHAGDEIRFQVLRDGQPLPGLAVELRSDQSPLGLWRRTDDQGRARVKVPLAGNWLLRGTDLRLSTTRADAWDSRFVTLAFSVAARPD